MRARRSSRPNRLDRLDELQAQLSGLYHELRFMADLIDTAPAQRWDIDSRGLSALLNRITDSLQAAQEATTAAWRSESR